MADIVCRLWPHYDSIREGIPGVDILKKVIKQGYSQGDLFKVITEWQVNYLNDLPFKGLFRESCPLRCVLRHKIHCGAKSISIYSAPGYILQVISVEKISYLYPQTQYRSYKIKLLCKQGRICKYLHEPYDPTNIQKS